MKELKDYTKSELIEAIKKMGHIIRSLDNKEHKEFWTMDGEYINSPEALMRD